MLVGKEVNVYRVPASQALQQGEEPRYKGKVMALSTYQGSAQEESITLAVIMRADGTLEEEVLGYIQVILKK